MLDPIHVDVASSQLQLALLLQAEGRVDEAAAAVGPCLHQLLDNPELGPDGDGDGSGGGMGGDGGRGGGRARSPLVATALHALGCLALQVRPIQATYLTPPF